MRRNLTTNNNLDSNLFFENKSKVITDISTLIDLLENPEEITRRRINTLRTYFENNQKHQQQLKERAYAEVAENDILIKETLMINYLSTVSSYKSVIESVKQNELNFDEELYESVKTDIHEYRINVLKMMFLLWRHIQHINPHVVKFDTVSLPYENTKTRLNIENYENNYNTVEIDLTALPLRVLNNNERIKSIHDNMLYFGSRLDINEVNAKVEEIRQKEDFINFINNCGYNIEIHSEHNFYNYYNKRLLIDLYELKFILDVIFSEDRRYSEEFKEFYFKNKQLTNVVFYLIRNTDVDIVLEDIKDIMIYFYALYNYMLKKITLIIKDKDENSRISQKIKDDEIKLINESLRYYFIEYITNFPHFDTVESNDYFELVSYNIFFFMNFHDRYYYEYYRLEQPRILPPIITNKNADEGGIMFDIISEESFSIRRNQTVANENLTFYPYEEFKNIYIGNIKKVKEDGFKLSEYFGTRERLITRNDKACHYETMNESNEYDIAFLYQNIPLFAKIYDKIHKRNSNYILKLNDIEIQIYEWIKNFYYNNHKSLFVFYDLSRFKDYFEVYGVEKIGKLICYPLIEKTIFKNNNFENINNPINIIQTQTEINKIKWTLGLYYKMFIYVYLNDENNESIMNNMFRNRITKDIDIKNNYNKYSYENNNGLRIIIPIINLPDYFLTNNVGIIPSVRDFFESYEEVTSNSKAFMQLSPHLINRIEIGIEGYNIQPNNNKLEGKFLPIRVLLEDDIMNRFIKDTQLFGPNIVPDLSVNCFVNSLKVFVGNVITEEEYYYISSVLPYENITYEMIKEISNEYKIRFIIKIIDFNDGYKISYKYIGKNKDKEITINLVKYGVFNHFVPEIKVKGINNFCVHNLNLRNEKYYNVVKIRKPAMVENKEIIVKDKKYNKESFIVRSQTNDVKNNVNSSDLLIELHKQKLLEWLSHYELEKLKLNTDNVTIELNKSIVYKELITSTIKIDKEKEFNEELYVADTETYYGENTVLVPYCICLQTKDHVISFYGKDCQSNFLNHVAEREIKRVYFHNLKFDGWLFKNFKITNIIYHASKLYSITIKYKKRYIELRDSLCLIPTAIRNFNKMFNLGEGNDKDLFPYNIMNEEKFIQNKFTLEEIKNYYNDEDYKEFIRQNKEIIQNDEVDIKKLTIKYCKQDVNILFNGLQKFKLLCEDMFMLNPLNSLTISAYSYKIMKIKCFKGLKEYNGDIKNFIRKSITGGRCMIANNTKIRVVNKVVDFDACSLYPSAMHRLYLPTGDIEYSNDIEEIKDMFYNKLMNEEQTERSLYKNISAMILKVKIIKINKERKFPLISIKNKNGNNWSNNIENEEIYCTHIELQDYIKYQEIEFEFIECLYWKNKKDTRMAEYIKECYEKRKMYKKEGNPLQEVLKLFMNSSYGKTIQKDIKNQALLIDPEKEYDKLLSYFGRIKHVKELNNRSWWFDVSSDKKPKAVPCYIGSLILGMSKRIMNEVICLAEDNNIDVYYQDTDSIHMREEDVPKLQQLFKEQYNRELIGTNMGQFHVDFPAKNGAVPYSRKSIFLGKKSYLDILVYPDGTESEFIRMKGIPESVIRNTCKELNITVEELYEELFNGEEYDFDLLKGDNPRFEFMTNFGIKLRDKFERKIKF